MTDIRLVTRADDVGSFHSANRAALECWKHGLLRNISLLAVAPYMEEAATMFAEERGLCAGVHLTINGEWSTARWRPVLPAAQVPSLVDKEGYLLQNPGLNHKKGVVFSQTMAELQAQLDKLRRLGFDVAYCDTHMMFGWLFEASDESRKLEQAMEQWAKAQGLMYTNTLATVSWMHVPEREDLDPVARLMAGLDGAKPGTYVVVGHAAYDDEEMRALSLGDGHRVAEARDWERRLFCDPRIVAYCRKKGIKPVTYREAAG
jgi:predicted glycoside hydrolase/deacetylase ChbG (UPF0249 family)